MGSSTPTLDPTTLAHTTHEEILDLEDNLHTSGFKFTILKSQRDIHNILNQSSVTGKLMRAAVATSKAMLTFALKDGNFNETQKRDIIQAKSSFNEVGDITSALYALFDKENNGIGRPKGRVRDPFEYEHNIPKYLENKLYSLGIWEMSQIENLKEDTTKKKDILKGVFRLIGWNPEELNVLFSSEDVGINTLLHDPDKKKECIQEIIGDVEFLREIRKGFEDDTSNEAKCFATCRNALQGDAGFHKKVFTQYMQYLQETQDTSIEWNDNRAGFLRSLQFDVIKDSVDKDVTRLVGYLDIEKPKGFVEKKMNPLPMHIDSKKGVLIIDTSESPIEIQNTPHLKKSPKTNAKSIGGEITVTKGTTVETFTSSRGSVEIPLAALTGAAKIEQNEKFSAEVLMQSEVVDHELALSGLPQILVHKEVVDGHKLNALLASVQPEQPSDIKIVGVADNEPITDFPLVIQGKSTPASTVEVKIFDAGGRVVTTLSGRVGNDGSFSVTQPSLLQKGKYMFQIQATYNSNVSAISVFKKEVKEDTEERIDMTDPKGDVKGDVLTVKGIGRSGQLVDIVLINSNNDELVKTVKIKMDGSWQRDFKNLESDEYTIQVRKNGSTAVDESVTIKYEEPESPKPKVEKPVVGQFGRRTGYAGDWVTSGVVSVTGLIGNVEVSVGSGRFYVNGAGPYTSPQSVPNNAQIRIEGTALARTGEVETITMNIGSEVRTFEVETIDRPTTTATVEKPVVGQFGRRTGYAGDWVTSGVVNVTGLIGNVEVSVGSGRFYVNGAGPYTSPQSVPNNAQIRIEGTALARTGEVETITMNIGSEVRTFEVETIDRPTTTATVEKPVVGQFGRRTGYAGDWVTSGVVNVTGLIGNVEVSVGSGRFYVNGAGPYTSPQSVPNNAQIRIEGTALARTGEVETITMNIGSEVRTFEVETIDRPTTTATVEKPVVGQFGRRTGYAGDWVTSGVVNVTGLIGNVEVSVGSGRFYVNGAGPYTSPQSVPNNAQIRIEGTALARTGEVETITMNIGSEVRTFEVETIDRPTTTATVEKPVVGQFGRRTGYAGDWVTSGVVNVTGLIGNVEVSVGSGRFYVNGAGPYTSPQSVPNNAQIRIEGTALARTGEVETITMNIGSEVRTFEVETIDRPTTTPSTPVAISTPATNRVIGNENHDMLFEGTGPANQAGGTIQIYAVNARGGRGRLLHTEDNVNTNDTGNNAGARSQTVDMRGRGAGTYDCVVTFGATSQTKRINYEPVTPPLTGRPTLDDRVENQTTTNGRARISGRCPANMNYVQIQDENGAVVQQGPLGLPWYRMGAQARGMARDMFGGDNNTRFEFEVNVPVGGATYTVVCGNRDPDGTFTPSTDSATAHIDYPEIYSKRVTVNSPNRIETDQEVTFSGGVDDGVKQVVLWKPGSSYRRTITVTDGSWQTAINGFTRNRRHTYMVAAVETINGKDVTGPATPITFRVRLDEENQPERKHWWQFRRKKRRGAAPASGGGGGSDGGGGGNGGGGGGGEGGSGGGGEKKKRKSLLGWVGDILSGNNQLVDALNKHASPFGKKADK